MLGMPVALVQNLTFPLIKLQLPLEKTTKAATTTFNMRVKSAQLAADLDQYTTAWKHPKKRHSDSHQHPA